MNKGLKSICFGFDVADYVELLKFDIIWEILRDTQHPTPSPSLINNFPYSSSLFYREME